MDSLSAVFRWMHIFAGIIWIGMLYFFNWVNGPFTATLDGETKKKVVPELMPRALFWFRWGAAWTWITGFVLLLLVFYHGGIMFDGGRSWTSVSIFMAVWTFVMVVFYDEIHGATLGREVGIVRLILLGGWMGKLIGKDPKKFGILAFLGVAVMVAEMALVADFSYRAVNIHLGAMFGTMMAFNVWYRIWPAQQRIITAIKQGQAPDPADAALAGSRSKHNTYMSLPLVWAMINQHTTSFAGGNFGIPSQYSFVVLLAVVLLGWHIVWHCYRKGGKVKGF